MSYFWKISQCNTTFDLKINLGHSDLYFLVQRFFFFYFFCSEKHFRSICKARFRRATLSCDSSYFLFYLCRLRHLSRRVSRRRHRHSYSNICKLRQSPSADRGTRKFKWASSCEKGTYRIDKQQRHSLTRALAVHTLNNWATTWQNQQTDMCAQRRLRSACASTQSDQILLFPWRSIGSLATHWVHSEDSDQTGWMPRLIWVFARRIVISLVISFRWLCHEVAQLYGTRGSFRQKATTLTLIEKLCLGVLKNLKPHDVKVFFSWDGSNIGQKQTWLFKVWVLDVAWSGRPILDVLWSNTQANKQRHLSYEPHHEKTC